MTFKPIILLTTVMLLAALCAADTDCTPGETTCLDCRTKQICTLFGPILSRCWLPGFSHCSDGKCGREPSEECRPPPSTEPPTSPPTTPTTAAPSTPAVPTTAAPVSTSPVPSTTEGVSTTVVSSNK